MGKVRLSNYQILTHQVIEQKKTDSKKDDKRMMEEAQKTGKFAVSSDLRKNRSRYR